MFWPTPEKSQRLDSPPPPKATPFVSDPMKVIPENAEWIAPAISYESYESKYGQLPVSLEGTHIPFNLQVDEQGNLVINNNLRRLFDYFFTTDGEESLDTIVVRLEELLEKHLPASASIRAIEVLHQYLNQKKSEIELSRQIDEDFKAAGEQPSIWEMKRLLRDLRASNLDAEVYEAFFGIENQRDDYTLSRLQIQQDSSLTDEERATALIEAEQHLPIDEQKQFAEERQIKQVFADVQAANAEGASKSEIFHIREQAFGAETAERYAEADKKVSSWDSRVSTYRAEREAILTIDGLTDDDKENQIEQLRQQHFQGNELKRIPVIDEMKDTESQ